MRVGVGGTFNVIHKGHELLFETAFTVGDTVEVGLTSDEFAKSIKTVPVAPYFLGSRSSRSSSGDMENHSTSS